VFNTSKRVRLLYAIVFIVAKVLAAVNYVVHIELEKEGQGYPYNYAEANEDGTTAFKGSGSQL